MEKDVLETMFEMYVEEAMAILNGKGANYLLTTAYIDIFQTRNVLLWVQEKVMIEKAKCHKAVNRLKRIAKYADASDIIFFSDIYNEKVSVQNKLASYEKLLNTGIDNHNQIALAEDMSILPYHYATIKFINYGIINQDNYSDELLRKITCYQKGEEFKAIYYDKSDEFIPFIKSKLDGIIINDIIGDGGIMFNTNNQKNKRFPN